MLYFLRHGISEANLAGIYAGAQLDSKLSEEGIELFEAYAQTVTQHFTTVYVSSLSRSIDSGSLFIKHASPAPVLMSDERIVELDFGALTGQPYQFFDSEEIYETYSIESKLSFYNRIKAFYDDIRSKADLEDVLVIGHSGVGMILRAIADGVPYNAYNTVPKPDKTEILLIK